MPRRLATLLVCALAAVACSAPQEADAQSLLSPIVTLEADANGAMNIRVAERVYTAFTPSRTVQDLTDPRLDIVTNVPILVQNVNGGNSDYGIYISNRSPVSIDRYRYVNWAASGEIYGGAIKINRSSPAVTYIHRVFADAMEAPDSSYDRSNTDFIGIERNATPVYVRDATGRNFGDAGIDAKSNVALMNVTINGAHRGLRAWSGVTMTIANSIINVPAGQEQVWLQGSTSRVRYYNTLWCIGSANPSPNDPACSTNPTAIGVDGVTLSQARQQIMPLSSNTLASNPFFATQIDRVVVQYSSNGGRNWTTMATGGSPGSAPRGDLRYRIPVNLSSGAYLFRAYFERNGSRIGSIATVNESGAAVSV